MLTRFIILQMQTLIRRQTTSKRPRIYWSRPGTFAKCHFKMPRTCEVPSRSPFAGRKSLGMKRSALNRLQQSNLSWLVVVMELLHTLATGIIVKMATGCLNQQSTLTCEICSLLVCSLSLVNVVYQWSWLATLSFGATVGEEHHTPANGVTRAVNMEDWST